MYIGQTDPHVHRQHTGNDKTFYILPFHPHRSIFYKLGNRFREGSDLFKSTQLVNGRDGTKTHVLPELPRRWEAGGRLCRLAGWRDLLCCCRGFSSGCEVRLASPVAAQSWRTLI